MFLYQLPCTTKGDQPLTSELSKQAEMKLRLTAELARQAEIRLRKSLMRLAQKRSIAGVKAALALAYWDELDVPTKILS